LVKDVCAMTWSIVAVDPASGAFAVAIASRAFAIGARCPFVRAGVGAVATQSISNPYLGPRVLDLLERGGAPADAIAVALAGDAGRDLRQIHAVDRHGRTAAWTGRNCVDWAGDRSGEGVSVAGNMMINDKVVSATFDGFVASKGLLAERLIAGLDTGEAAGGDRRGRQAAGLKLATTEDFPDIDLRVDDHPTPLVELRRLLAVYRQQLEPNRAMYPTKANPSGMIDLDAIETLLHSRGLGLRLRR
jgi:uncharacterized Ntn-hydrolase superfamily protein